jgi:hypothetical protein
MKRRLVNYVGLASLALFIATVALWLSQSHVTLSWGSASADQLGYQCRIIEYTGYGPYVGDFAIRFEPELAEDALIQGAESIYTRGFSVRINPAVSWSALGHFGTLNQFRKGPIGRWHYRGVQLPHWLVAGVFLAGSLPFWAATNRFRKRRSALRNDRCTTCGYDLRESPDRCPECGTPRPSST